MSDRTLTLFSSDLLSKHGFNDGDSPDEVWDLLDTAGRADVMRNWREVLLHLVEERLLPALDQRVEVYRLGTSHNPIRALTIDGVDVESMGDAVVELTPESVEVPMEHVVNLLLATRPTS